MREPSHQLVIQFPESAFQEFDDIVQYEDGLMQILGDNHDVEGHDFGSGEVIFFVFTDDPHTALTTIREARGGVLLSHPAVRGAARRVDGEVFELLWPIDDLREFFVV